MTGSPGLMVINLINIIAQINSGDALAVVLERSDSGDSRLGSLMLSGLSQPLQELSLLRKATEQTLA